MSLLRNSTRCFSELLKSVGKFQNSTSYGASNSFRKLHISQTDMVEGIPLKMPSLSPTMSEGKIVKWLKQEGDVIQPGDVLCDIETDKAVVSFEIEEEGTLAKILVDETAGTINIGTLIAVMAPEGEDWKTIEIPKDTETESSSPSEQRETSQTTTSGADEGGARLYGPSVRLLLQDYGLNENTVTCSGPHGALLKGDVLQYIKQSGISKRPQQDTAPVTSSSTSPSSPPFQCLPSFTDIEVTGMRRTIAKRLHQSKSSIAHSYGTLECKVDELNALRQQMKREGANVSINDLIIKAVGVALEACPVINSVWNGNQLEVSPTIDISIAVATPSGLITPIITDVTNKGVKDISMAVRDLATRAKQNKLKPTEFQGGSFTISNLGMFGIKEFTAIINPPQCAILAVGGSRLVPGPDGFPKTLMRATLSYDRLAIEDHMAAEFLSTLTKVIESPRENLGGGVIANSSVMPIEHPLSALL